MSLHSRRVVALVIGLFAIIGAYQNCKLVGTPFKAVENLSSTLPKLANSNESSAVGQAFFQDSVTPLFVTNCRSCHSLPKDGGDGPLTIFDYSGARKLLALQVAGGPPNLLNSTFFQKVTNVIAHTGQDQCPGGPTDPVCLKLAEWWDREFGTPSGASDPKMKSDILSVSEFGEVYGYAMLPASSSEKVHIRVYLNGAVGSGTLLPDVIADKGGSLPNYSGHYFRFQMPKEYRDQKPHALYLYAGTESPEYLVGGEAKLVAAYDYSPAGRDFYTAKLLPQLQQNCSACHNGIVNYEEHFSRLLRPTPYQGGKASDNFLLNKISGGVAHSGGKICDSKDSGLCKAIQDWWTVEFAP